MKKLVLSVFGLSMAMFSTVVSANTNNVNSVISIKLDDEKTAVKAEELPEAVKKTLAGEAFAGFGVTEVFLVKGADGAAHYEVTLTKGEEKQVAKLDVNGNILK